MTSISTKMSNSVILALKASYDWVLNGLLSVVLIFSGDALDISARCTVPPAEAEARI
jgi:hypothetical protein